MAKKDDNLFGRKDPVKKVADSAVKSRAARAAALCKSAYFREWMFATLDDLSGFARDEGLLTEFGQGIRAAAARIQDQLLYAPEAVDFLAELYRRNLKADHERVVAEAKGK